VYLDQIKITVSMTHAKHMLDLQVFYLVPYFLLSSS